MQFSWLPKSGSLTFVAVFSLLFTQRSYSSPNLPVLMVWVQVMMPGQQQSLKRSCAHVWQDLARGRQRDEEQAWWQWRWGQMGKKQGTKVVWTWGIILAALMWTVEEEGGWDGGEIDAMPIKYLTNWKISDSLGSVLHKLNCSSCHF